jgi:hypothetical protein
VSGKRFDPNLVKRLAACGIRPVEVDDGRLLAECFACRTRWEIAGSRLGLPTEDETADWWWCPNGCNRAE